ncbi:MAG: DUF3179 domain-containing protein [SAR202 cluster bacterium]|nr:DUF3179 domain-containing protein [SAR202 cluster bacterium]
MKYRWAALLAGLLALAVACSGAAELEVEKPEPTGGTIVAQPVVPQLDQSIHSLPLDDILFDTFGTTSARFVPLDEISDELQNGLRDAIVPVDRPAYGEPDSLPWLTDEHLIIGYESGSETFAYPINILNFHEIVNDTIGGEPFLVTYCPLCFSGVVFSRNVDGETLTFGNTSALYQSDLVMYDHQTGSYWFQVAGEAVVGTLTGSRLKPLPSATMPWGDWKTLHPGTRLMTGTEQQETLFATSRYASGFGSGYQDRINNEQFAFPVDADKLDGRLSAGEIVLTVEVGVDGGATAFPLGIIGDGAANAEVGGLPVVVFTTAGGLSVGAFSRDTNGQTLTFSYEKDDQNFVDEETGSTWDMAGRAQSGPLLGSRLDRMSTRRSFWFAVAISFPGIEIYNP